ncbi:hypothetical protein ALC57_01533 [Trachymyrmex cornetzi]|uniref:DNA helicase Pif1-like 2B domain-containing protein n=1 Tax=Trachymyrmex cornetzi TaxID=471704 RepID=A0A151JQ23_9HYME|nr:hypothetical protein ALC57_01533 [Trachymyrmex cornetzi]
MFARKRIRQQILKNKVANALTDSNCVYVERKRCNILAVRRSVEERIQQEVWVFFTALVSTYSPCMWYMNQLPVDTICLLPFKIVHGMCYLCKVLNTTMLDKIDGDEIRLIAEDDVDCAPAMKKKVYKILKDEDDNVSETAGSERVIAIKIGAKAMIRRNIDVTLGLVNGTIGNVVAVNRCVDGNRIDSIKIVISDNKEITITKVDIKFEVFHKMVVHRKQFPLSLIYGIIIPSRQTISNLIARARDGRLRCQRKKKDRTEDTVLNIVILGMVAFNPHVCQRKISLELNTSLSTVNRVLRSDVLQFLQNDLLGLLEDINLQTRRDMWFQHNGAPAHSAGVARDCLNE